MAGEIAVDRQLRPADPAHEWVQGPLVRAKQCAKNPAGEVRNHWPSPKRRAE